MPARTSFRMAASGRKHPLVHFVPVSVSEVDTGLSQRRQSMLTDHVIVADLPAQDVDGTVQLLAAHRILRCERVDVGELLVDQVSDSLPECAQTGHSWKDQERATEEQISPVLVAEPFMHDLNRRHRLLHHRHSLCFLE